MTKNILPYLIVFAVFSSCTEDVIPYKDKLAGTWKLGSGNDSKKLTFTNNNFQYDFKDIQIGGYFICLEIACQEQLLFTEERVQQRFTLKILKVN